MLGSVVLFMEALVMGFALLLVRGHHTHHAVLLGSILALILLVSPRFLKNKKGWILGSILQIAIIFFGIEISIMWFIGVIFAMLWTAAFFIGKKGEERAAQIRAERENQG